MTWEDPIAALKSNGYMSLVDTFVGQDAYSYVFDGQSGYLDHALASAALSTQVVGVTEWYINADEPLVLGYNQEYNPAYLYTPGPYRASDHDPVIVNLDLKSAPKIPTCKGQPATIYVGKDGKVVGGPLDARPYAGILFGNRHVNVIVGTEGNDVIHGGLAGDVVCGLAGDDVLHGGIGRDHLLGGDGHDVLEVASATTCSTATTCSMAALAPTGSTVALVRTF